MQEKQQDSGREEDDVMSLMARKTKPKVHHLVLRVPCYRVCVGLLEELLLCPQVVHDAVIVVVHHSKLVAAVYTCACEREKKGRHKQAKKRKHTNKG